MEFFNENPRQPRLLDRKKDTYICIRNCTNVNDSFPSINSLSLPLLLPSWGDKVARGQFIQTRNSFTAIRCKIRCNEFVIIIDHNSSSNYPLRRAYVYTYIRIIEKLLNDLFDGGGEEFLESIGGVSNLGGAKEGIIRATTICLARDRVDRVIENSLRGPRIDYSMINHRLYCAYHNGLRKRIY